MGPGELNSSPVGQGCRQPHSSRDSSFLLPFVSWEHQQPALISLVSTREAQGVLGHVPTTAARKASSSFHPSALHVQALPSVLRSRRRLLRVRGNGCGICTPAPALGVQLGSSQSRGRIPAPVRPCPPGRAKPGRPQGLAPSAPYAGGWGFPKNSRPLCNTPKPWTYFPSGAPQIAPLPPLLHGSLRPHHAHSGFSPIC